MKTEEPRPFLATLLVLATLVLALTGCVIDPIAAPSPTREATHTVEPRTAPAVVPPTAEPLTPSPAPIVSLQQAIEQGLADLQIMGTGSASGNSITIVARRVGDHLPTIRVDPGTVLVSSVGSEQDMVVRRLLGWRIDKQQYTPADFITLYGPAGSSQNYAVEAYCLDLSKASPSSSTTFSLGGLPPANVLAVLQAADQVPGAGEDVSAIQVAIWVVTDNVTEAEAVSKGYQPILEQVQAILQAAGLDPTCYRYFGGSCSASPTPAAPVSPPSLPVSPTATVLPLGLRVTRQALLEDYFTRQLAWSPDGRYLVIDADKVYIYDAQTLQQVYAFDRIQSASSLAFSPDGQLLATASSDGVKLWSTDGWSEVRTLAGSKDTEGLAFSPDGTMLATAIGSTVKLWDVAGGQELRTLPGSSGRAVAFSPDGRILAAAGGVAGQDIKLWAMPGGEELPALTGHTNWINDLAFSPDGKLLATGSVDQSIRLWDVAARRQVRVLSGHTGEVTSGDVTSVAFSPDGRLLASASRDLTVRLWDVATGKELATLTGHSKEVNAVAWSPDGTLLATGASDVRVWKVELGVSPEPTVTPIPAGPLPTPVPLSVRAISPENALRVTQVGTLETEWVYQVVFSPDGKYLAMGSTQTYIYDAQTLQQVYAFDRFQSGSGLAWSPDGQLLAIASSDGVKLWSTDGWSELRALVGSKDTGSVAWSPDGRLLATATGNTVKIWDAQSGSEVRTLLPGSATVVAFSPDGLTLAAGGGVAAREIKLWDVASWEELATLKGHSNWVNSLAFSPDGKLLATGSVDQSIRLWDVAARRQVRVLSGHTGEVSSVAFSPGGRLLASASRDLTVRLWDVATGKELITLTGHSGELRGVAFSPDGATLVSAGYDQAVRLWGVAP